MYQIFKVGSIAPAALVYDSFLCYQENKNKDKINKHKLSQLHLKTSASDFVTIYNLRRKNLLANGVRGCLQAATHEISDYTLQSTLLESVAYGKVFVDNQDAKLHQEFTNTCAKLRIVNQLKQVGVTLTISQYETLSPETIVLRLANRGMLNLAIAVCSTAGVKKENVLVHWALKQVFGTLN